LDGHCWHLGKPEHLLDSAKPIKGSAFVFYHAHCHEGISLLIVCVIVNNQASLFLKAQRNILFELMSCIAARFQFAISRMTLRRIEYTMKQRNCRSRYSFQPSPFLACYSSLFNTLESYGSNENVSKGI
jgi:hypothetical protein